MPTPPDSTPPSSQSPKSALPSEVPPEDALPKGGLGRVLAGWAVILGICGFAMGLFGPSPEAASDSEAVSGEAPIGAAEEMSGRLSLALGRMLPEDQRGGVIEMSGLVGGGFSSGLEVGPRRRLAAAVLDAEVNSPAAGLGRLPDSIDEGEAAELEAVRAWLRESLEAMRDERDVPIPDEGIEATLLEELGWFGAVAADWTMPPEAPSRLARAAAADRALLALGAFVAWFAVMGLLGFAAGLVLIVLMALGRVRARVVAEDRGGRFGLIYLETFVIWMLFFFGGQLLLAVALPAVGLLGPAALFIASLGVLGWPLLRGISPGQVADDVGLRWGRRWWASPLAGVGTYAIGLPLILMGLLLALLVSALLPGAAPPSHPIQEEIASAGLGGVLALVMLAAVIVPPVEEIFFRGVLYRHLRELWGRFGTGLAVALSVLLSSVLFAALHPQGVTFIPVLASLAVAFSISREVTGSIWPATIAHGISNGVVVSLNALLFAG